MTTKEKMIEDILERLKDYEDDTGIIEIGGNQLRLLLKEYLQEPTEEREVEIDRNDSIINMKYKITI